MPFQVILGDQLVWIYYAEVSWSTLRQGNEGVGMHYAGVSQRTVHEGYDAVGMHDAGVSHTMGSVAESGTESVMELGHGIEH